MYRSRNSSSRSNSAGESRGYGGSRNSGGSRSSGGSRNSGGYSRSNSSSNGGGSRGRFSRAGGSSNRFRGNGGGNGGGRRFSKFSRHKQASFNPSMLVNKAEPKSTAPVYEAEHKFTDFAVDPQLMKNIVKRGYENPTPIQDQVIPHILEGKDVAGLASTGTGKTAAFLIPLIHNVFNEKNGKVLIMAPTRELALQIESELKIFTQGMEVFSTLCIGGANIHRQVDSLRRNPHFVIGTPGRLIDLEQRNKLKLQDFTAIVLDEVDQMFDMGFINDIKYVVNRLPEERHSLFFSATLPDKLNQVVHSFLNNPIKVKVPSVQSAANIYQDIVKVNGQSKVDILHDLLVKEEFDKVLVFGRTKHGLNKLSDILFDRGFKVAVIHGNKSQGQRQRALKQFKQNFVKVLLATDVASRGLDIDNVTHVINYDLPQTYEDYIHRIGRTGRANKTGVALSFVD
jgi:ATP-dependent RNA helicase RhlE